jgi:hypothetical protein
MVNTMIPGVCPWHVSLTPQWSAMATYELSSSSSSIIIEIKIVRHKNWVGQQKKKKKRKKKTTAGMFTLYLLRVN